MPTYQTEIMREARTLARLQLKRRNLRAELRKIDGDIRVSKRTMRKLVSAATDWQESGAASAVLGTEAGE